MEVWCGVNWMIIHFFEASIPSSVRSSVHPFLQIILELSLQCEMESNQFGPPTTFAFSSVWFFLCGPLRSTAYWPIMEPSIRHQKAGFPSRLLLGWLRLRVFVLGSCYGSGYGSGFRGNSLFKFVWNSLRNVWNKLFACTVYIVYFYSFSIVSFEIFFKY